MVDIPIADIMWEDDFIDFLAVVAGFTPQVGPLLQFAISKFKDYYIKVEEMKRFWEDYLPEFLNEDFQTVVGTRFPSKENIKDSELNNLCNGHGPVIPLR
jgi:hypothetical protein